MITRVSENTKSDSKPERRYLDRIPLAAVRNAREEWASTITHAVATIGSGVAFGELIRLSLSGGHGGLLLPIVVFGVTLLNLYLVSTLYHFIRRGRIKRLFRIIDHVSILYLIAGTYTVVLMLFMSTPLRWVVLFIEWGLALAGTLYKLLSVGGNRVISIVLYLLMGYMALVLFPQLRALKEGGLVYWVVLGGLAYTVGLVFYGLKRMPYHHSVWHLFVMAGSACHVIGIYQAAKIIYG